MGKVLSHKDFYESKVWFKLRLAIYKSSPLICLKCGSSKDIEIDHIKPKSTHPHLSFDVFNLQPLCRECNQEKSNLNSYDYRDSDFILSLIDFIESSKIDYKKIKRTYKPSKFVSTYTKRHKKIRLSKFKAKN
jgi:hypothetical protein